MHFQIINVTPGMAMQWLESNGKNRRFSARHAEKIAKSIERGEWVLNGETICFDENGRLLDGQHRLRAIHQSGKTVPVAIVTGVSDPSAFETYDSVQRTRGADQIAEMKGVADSRRVTAAARVVLAWDRSNTVEEFHRAIMGSFDATPHDISEKAVEIEREAEYCREMIGDSILKITRVGSALIGILVVLNRIDPVNTRSFCTKVRTGVVSSESDPALIYRDRMMSGSGDFRNQRRWRVAAMAVTIKAWNANKTGKIIKTLRLRQDGDTPEKFPSPVGGGKS